MHQWRVILAPRTCSQLACSHTLTLPSADAVMTTRGSSTVTPMHTIGLTCPLRMRHGSAPHRTNLLHTMPGGVQTRIKRCTDITCKSERKEGMLLEVRGMREWTVNEACGAWKNEEWGMEEGEMGAVAVKQARTRCCRTRSLPVHPWRMAPTPSHTLVRRL